MTRDMRLRDRIDAGTYVDQANMRDALVAQAALSEADRSAILCLRHPIGDGHPRPFLARFDGGLPR